MKVKVRSKVTTVAPEPVEHTPSTNGKPQVAISPRGATINREDFVYLLESVKAGLSPREIVEQSSCIAFKDGRVVTFNEEVMCSAPSGLPKEWTAAVQHKPLIDQVHKWPDETLTISLGEVFKVSAGARLLELNMERQVLMPLEKVEQPGTNWKPMHEDLTDAISIVESCAGKDESNQALTCIHVTPDWIEACDNFQLTRYKFKTGFSESCIKRDSLKIVPALEMREYTETETWLHFRGKSGLILSVRKHKEEYNDLSPFLEVQGTKTILPKGVADAVERAKLLSDENADNPQIKVDLHNGRIVIVGEGASGKFTETKKVKYSGERIKFTVGPQLFLDLIKRHTDCVVSPNYRIKVDGPSWRFVACLDPVTTAKSKEE